MDVYNLNQPTGCNLCIRFFKHKIMKYILFTFYIFFTFFIQLQGQSTSVRYPGHESVVSYSFYENDTLYLGIANALDYRRDYYNASSFFKQVKLTKQNNAIWQSAAYTAVDSTIPSLIDATFLKIDSQYIAVGTAKISQQLQHIGYYVGNSTTIDSLKNLPFTASGFWMSSLLPHPTKDSILLIAGFQRFNMLVQHIIVEFNIYSETYILHTYDNNPNYKGFIEELLYDEKQHKYIFLTLLPLPPNMSRNPMPSTAFAYLDTNFVLDTTVLISSTIELTYPSHLGGDKSFLRSNMVWATDSTIMVTGEVPNRTYIGRPNGPNRYGADIGVTIRNAADFSEIGTSKVYGKLDTGETSGAKKYPLIKMDSNLFVTSATMEYEGYYKGSNWNTELALLGIDKNGNKHWMKYFPYNDYCAVDRILPDESGGLWVVSQCSNADTTGGDWFVKVMYLDSVAYWPRIGQTSGLYENNSAWSKEFNIFPNPATNKIIIRQYGNPQFLDAVIYDVNGRWIKNAVLSDVDSSIDVSDLKIGMYIVKIEKDGEILATKKLMLQ